MSTLTSLSYTNLLFDPENPRLPKSVTGADSMRLVLEYMISNANVVDLMFSIGESGFFDGEPLLVVEAQVESGKYYVVEGNRRLAALKLLHNPELAPVKKNTVSEISSNAKHKPFEIPCIIYSDRADVLDFLGYRHITGIDEWDSLMKAKYLKQLYDHYIISESNTTVYTILAKKIGSRSDSVKRLLTGYTIYEKLENNDFYGIKNLSEDNFSFSLLTTALSYNNIKEFIFGQDDSSSIEDGNLEKLTRWVFEKNADNNKTVLGESRNLKILNSIVAAPLALQKLEGGSSIEEAQLFSDHPSIVFSEAIIQAYNRLKDAKSVSHHVLLFKESDLDNVKGINSIARELRLLITDQLENN